MPTGEERKPLLCRLDDDGQWVAIGRIEPVFDISAIPKECYGMDVSDKGVSFDDFSVELSFNAKVSTEIMFKIMGVDVVNIIFCKDCKYNHDNMNCPMYRKAYAFDRRDTDFCSFGVKK